MYGDETNSSKGYHRGYWCGDHSGQRDENGVDKLSELIQRSYEQLQIGMGSGTYQRQSTVKRLQDGLIAGGDEDLLGEVVNCSGNDVLRGKSNLTEQHETVEADDNRDQKDQFHQAQENSFYHRYLNQQDFQSKDQRNYQNFNSLSNQSNNSAQYYKFVPKQSLPLYHTHYQQEDSRIMARNSPYKNYTNTLKQRQQRHLNKDDKDVRSQAKQVSGSQRPGFIKHQRRFNSINKQQLSLSKQYSSCLSNAYQQQLEVRDSKRLKDQSKVYKDHCQPLHQQQIFKHQNYLRQDDQCRIKQPQGDKCFSDQQSLKHTIESSNQYIINHLNSAPQQGEKFEAQTTHIPNSQAPLDEFSDDLRSIYNEAQRQYEADLFEFIKRQLIRVTVQNKNTLERESGDDGGFDALKQKNRQLYRSYQDAKKAFNQMVKQQQSSLKSLNDEISLLTQQCEFYRSQIAKVQISITQKMHKQQELNFRHKANLQNIIVRNNQLIADLKSQLDQVQRKRYSSIQQYVDSSVLLNENLQLKQQIYEEKELYNRNFQKFMTQKSKISSLRLKKEQEINKVFEQLQYAKRLADYGVRRR